MMPRMSCKNLISRCRNRYSKYYCELTILKSNWQKRFMDEKEKNENLSLSDQLHNRSFHILDRERVAIEFTMNKNDKCLCKV